MAHTSSSSVPSTTTDARSSAAGLGAWGQIWAALRTNPAGLLSALVVAALTVAALAAALTPYDPTLGDTAAMLQRPSLAHPLGTDMLGRDALARLLYGARTSLSVGLFSQAVVVAIGIPIGLLAGWLGGRTDNLSMRLVDVVYAFPDLLLIILLRSIFGSSILMIVVVIGLVEWPTLARLARAQVLALREREFILGARAAGAGWGRVLVHHVLPNAVGPLVVATVFGIPRAIFAEAALTYIGLGVQPSTPSWGGMVYTGYQYIADAPYLIVPPALAIAALTLSFTVLADVLRDALDPRRSQHP